MRVSVPISRVHRLHAFQRQNLASSRISGRSERFPLRIFQSAKRTFRSEWPLDCLDDGLRLTGRMAILTYLHLMWESSRARSALFFSLLLLSSVTEGIGLVVLVPLLGTLQETQADPSGVVALVVNVLSYLQIPITFIGLLGVFLALNILRATILFAQTIVSEHFRLRILDDLRTAGFDAILQSRWDWITAQKKSDISSLLINEINRIGSALTFSVRLIVSLLSIAAYVVAAISH